MPSIIWHTRNTLQIAARDSQDQNFALHPEGRISDLLKILLAYFTFSWKKELHVVAGDLSGTNDIAGSTRMVAWVDRGACGLESEALGTGAMRVVGLAQRQGAAEGFCGTQFSAQASRARTDRTAACARIQKEWAENGWVGEGGF